MATTRKTAAQKAAEAAERDEYTTPIDHSQAEAAVAAVEEAAGAEPGKLAHKKETVQQLKNRLRNEAEREVLDRHKAEVIKITGAKYDAHGLEYVRRLTDEEKAAKAIEEYYKRFPNLRPASVVQAEPGGALDQFRAADHDEPDISEYADVEEGAYSYEHGQPDGDQ